MSADANIKTIMGVYEAFGRGSRRRSRTLPHQYFEFEGRDPGPAPPPRREAVADYAREWAAAPQVRPPRPEADQARHAG